MSRLPNWRQLVTFVREARDAWVAGRNGTITLDELRDSIQTVTDCVEGYAAETNVDVCQLAKDYLMSVAKGRNYELSSALARQFASHVLLTSRGIDALKILRGEDGMHSRCIDLADYYIEPPPKPRKSLPTGNLRAA
jgi:hypothetical protein